jgi:electron transport complex protein RnfD
MSPPASTLPALADLSDRLNPLGSPFLRAPETARTIFLLVMAAAMGPLAAGLVFFGWRAVQVAALSVGACVAIEWLYYRLTRLPALMGRSHAYLTGVLLALTLPAHVPWYVPVVGAVFAILVGKAIFGGVGHFLWQPALVGRLAVAVLFAQQIANPLPQLPGAWPILAQNKIVVGDELNASYEASYRQWRRTPPAPGRDAFWLTSVQDKLAPLTRSSQGVEYSALATVPETPGAKPVMILQVPPIGDLLLGARPGGIGETCAAVIVVAGLYLVYRHYVKWQLPAAFVFSACVVAALAPIQLQGPGDTIVGAWGPPGGWLAMNWFSSAEPWTQPPLLREGLEVGFIYVCYQLLSGEFLLAAFFLATETTSRPVTTGGQILFGLGAGGAAMLMRLYVDTPIPAYIAVLLMNTFTPMIDTIWRPRVLGMRRYAWLRKTVERRA